MFVDRINCGSQLLGTVRGPVLVKARGVSGPSVTLSSPARCLSSLLVHDIISFATHRQMCYV